MKPQLLVLCLLAPAIAGCLANDAAAPNPTMPYAAPDANQTTPSLPIVDHDLVGDNITRNALTEYRVDTSGPVTVTLRTDGNVTWSGLVDGARAWTIPLDHGRTVLNVTIEASGFQAYDENLLVRLASARLTVDYCHFHPSSPSERKVDEYEYWVDLDATPASPLYDEVNATRPERFTAHDQLFLMETLDGVPVDEQYSATFSGFFVEYIDGAGNPASSDAPPYWLFEVNGEPADLGMSLIELAPDDHVRWILSTLGPPCE